MEYARDLGQVDLWEESLRRSLERRGRPRRSSVELHRLRPGRDLTLEDVIERSACYSQLRREAAQRPALPRPSAALGGVSAIALLAAATVPKLVGGGGGDHQPTATLQEAAATNPASPPAQVAIEPAIAGPTVHKARVAAPVVHRSTTARPATPARPVAAPPHNSRATTSAPRATIASVTSHSSGGAGLASTPAHTATKPHLPAAHPTPAVPKHHARAAAPTTTPHSSTPTPPPVSSSTYVNPLAHASVTPERIDQGVDYSGSGTLTALGAGRVVATSGGGWPGDFIEYRLTSGAYAGRYVYYAEHVAPVAGLHDGQSVQPGQAIATISGGVEVGWASGVGTQPLAQAEGQWHAGSDAENYATPAGRSFSALIASLGGPPGKAEG